MVYFYNIRRNNRDYFSEIHTKALNDNDLINIVYFNEFVFEPNETIEFQVFISFSIDLPLFIILYKPLIENAQIIKNNYEKSKRLQNTYLFYNIIKNTSDIKQTISTDKISCTISARQNINKNPIKSPEKSSLKSPDKINGHLETPKNSPTKHVNFIDLLK